MGIHEILTAARSPWQNAYVERFIGTVPRECLDHLIIFNESSLKRILTSYFEYYEHSRTHLYWKKIHRPHAPFKDPSRVEWSSHLRQVEFITAMSEEQLEA